MTNTNIDSNSNTEKIKESKAVKLEKLGKTKKHLSITNISNYDFIIPNIELYFKPNQSIESTAKLINIVNGLFVLQKSSIDFVLKYYKTIKAFAYNEKVYTNMTQNHIHHDYYSKPLLLTDVKTIINTCQLTGKLFSLDSLRIINTQKVKKGKIDNRRLINKDSNQENGKKRLKSSLVNNKYKIGLNNYEGNFTNDGNFYSIDGKVFTQNDIIDEALKSKGRVLFDENFIMKKINFDYTLLYKTYKEEEVSTSTECKKRNMIYMDNANEDKFNIIADDMYGNGINENDSQMKNGGEVMIIENKVKNKKVKRNNLFVIDYKYDNSIDMNRNVHYRSNKKENFIRSDLDVLFNVSHICIYI